MEIFCRRVSDRAWGPLGPVDGDGVGDDFAKNFETTTTLDCERGGRGRTDGDGDVRRRRDRERRRANEIRIEGESDADADDDGRRRGLDATESSAATRTEGGERGSGFGTTTNGSSSPMTTRAPDVGARGSGEARRCRTDENKSHQR